MLDCHVPEDYAPVLRPDDPAREFGQPLLRPCLSDRGEHPRQRSPAVQRHCPGPLRLHARAPGPARCPPPLIQLPAPLFIGSTSTRGASTHFGKVTRPDGVMLQLGQRSSSHDVWLWLLTGTSHSQASPWMSPFALSQWRECNELHFVTGLAPQGIQLITGKADFIRHFPPMSAMGARQHPQQGLLLNSSCGGGDGGAANGGLARPTTGLLWPRRV